MGCVYPGETGWLYRGCGGHDVTNLTYVIPCFYFATIRPMLCLKSLDMENRIFIEMDFVGLKCIFVCPACYIDRLIGDDRETCDSSGTATSCKNWPNNRS